MYIYRYIVFNYSVSTRGNSSINLLGCTAGIINFVCTTIWGLILLGVILRPTKVYNNIQQ